MAIPAKIRDYLGKNRVKCETIKHKTVYTSFDKAKTLKVKPSIIGKTLIVRTGKEVGVVLIPANKNLDMAGFKKTINSKPKPVFATEKWMKNNFKGIELGAVPPFGFLWDLRTFIDKGLLKNPKIIINSGAYDLSLKMTPAQLKKQIPDSIIGNFSKPRR